MYGDCSIFTATSELAQAGFDRNDLVDAYKLYKRRLCVSRNVHKTLQRRKVPDWIFKVLANLKDEWCTACCNSKDPCA
eukprot:m.19419 g.19419  ORF g.19419 m.19419 type:complete len:78 (-) comp8461_c0_seq1:54-287(-)